MRKRFPLRVRVFVAIAAALAPAACLYAATPAPAAAAAHDGQHDFDFLFGSWKVHLKRLLHPLTGSTTWTEYVGTATARPVWGGRANLDELEAESPTTHERIEGLTLRLYNPTTREWSLYWAAGKTGTLGLPPTVGHFEHGRGEFYDHEDFQGRPIVVRYVWSDITPTSAHFEQAFSADDGKTWEVNWIYDATRTKD